MEIDLKQPDIEYLLISLELPILALQSQLEYLLSTIQEDCLIKNIEAYNTICGQLTLSIAGVEYIKKIWNEYYQEFEEYLGNKLS